MSTATPSKKQEIVERERLLLETAGQVLMKEGLTALSMERLAEELNTAKGTIYNHYPNREEVLLALSVLAVSKRQELFDLASLSSGTAKQRILAVGVSCEIYYQNYLHYFIAESLVRNSAIWERCSDQRKELLKRQEARCMTLVSGIVRSGIADGQLKLSDGLLPEEMTLSLWALTYGSYLIDLTSPSLAEIGVQSSLRSVRIGCRGLIEGFGWQPYWSMDEYNAEYSRICKEVFPNEKALPHLSEL